MVKKVIFSCVIVLIDGFISYLFLSKNILSTFPIIALVAFYNKKRTKEYYLLAFIMGFLYDAIYYNIIFFNSIIFIIIAAFLLKVEKYLYDTFFSDFLLSLIVMVVYRTIIYLILLIIGYTRYNLNNLVESILYSIPFNTIFLIIIYVIKSYKKIKIKYKFLHRIE